MFITGSPFNSLIRPLKISLCLIGLLFLYSCRGKTPVTYIDMENIPLTDVDTDTVMMNEVMQPFSMYPFKQWLLLINVEPHAEFPLFVYNIESLKFSYATGKFGRGANEFFNINPYYFNKTDSSFFINTNEFWETEMLYDKDSITIGKSSRILNTPANNLLKINDSLFFSENRMEKFEYSIYNTKNKTKEKSFSDFPTSKIMYQSNDDRDNIYQKTCLYNKEKKSIIAFYQNIPLVRIYDEECKPVKEIKLKNIEDSPLTTKEFYQNKGKLYYSFPYSVGSKIYVLFENETLDSTYRSPDSEIQVWNWNGAIEKRYRLRCKFDLFTISDDGKIFYGLNKREENFYFIKGTLE